MRLREIVLASLLIAVTSGCSLIPTQSLEIQSRPIERQITPPAPIRPVELNDVKWYVVSEAKLVNRCNQIPKVDADGNPIMKDDGTQQTTRPKACDRADREYPDWPEGFSNQDQFEEIIREMNKGDLVYVALTISDYKILTQNNQDLVRWIKSANIQHQYWLDITGNNPDLEKEVEAVVTEKEPTQNRPSLLQSIIGGNDD